MDIAPTFTYEFTPFLTDTLSGSSWTYSAVIGDTTGSTSDNHLEEIVLDDVTGKYTATFTSNDIVNVASDHYIKGTYNSAEEFTGKITLTNTCACTEPAEVQKYIVLSDTPDDSYNDINVSQLFPKEGESGYCDFRPS